MQLRIPRPPSLPRWAQPICLRSVDERPKPLDPRLPKIRNGDGTGIGVHPRMAMGSYCTTLSGRPCQISGAPVSASRTPFNLGGLSESARASSSCACVNPWTGDLFAGARASAPDRSASRSTALVRSAPQNFAPDTSACLSSTPINFACRSLAQDRVVYGSIAPERLAFVSHAPDRFTSRSCKPLIFASRKYSLKFF